MNLSTHHSVPIIQDTQPATLPVPGKQPYSLVKNSGLWKNMNCDAMNFVSFINPKVTMQ